jgi:hypothetical protein
LAWPFATPEYGALCAGGAGPLKFISGELAELGIDGLDAMRRIRALAGIASRTPIIGTSKDLNNTRHSMISASISSADDK